MDEIAQFLSYAGILFSFFFFLQSRFNNIHVYFTFKIDTYKSVDCTLWFTILEFIQIKESLRKFSTSLFSWSSFV